jgi:hypothetical protein
MSMEPRPVTSSKPVVSRKPARPPVRVEVPGVLLLHMLGVAAEQPDTPEVETVVSWKAAGVEAAILYSRGLIFPAAVPTEVLMRATTPAMLGAEAEVPEKTSK